MSCKSAIYAVNTASTAISEGGTYSPTTVVRRFGQCCQLESNAITLNGCGYYDVAASVTLTGSAAGTVTMTVYQNGTDVTGMNATQSVGASGDVITLGVSGIVRNYCGTSTLTIVISGQAVTGTNLTVDVTKQ
jgi:hypothetical protein